MSKDDPVRPHLKAKFDQFADEYRDLHKKNINFIGGRPDYFSEYKVFDLYRIFEKTGTKPESILDFGSGIGNSIPYFRKYFPETSINGSDVSERSLEISRKRFPGKECYYCIGDNLPLDSCSQDVVFSACVFHHIPHEKHAFWLKELRRVTKKGGILFIYEHNPLNPLTMRAVNTCPLDEDAVLIPAGMMKKRIVQSGWNQAKARYKVFFPSFFSVLRPLEDYLGWLPLGGQYCVLARNPGSND